MILLLQNTLHTYTVATASFLYWSTSLCNTYMYTWIYKYKVHELRRKEYREVIIILIWNVINNFMNYTFLYLLILNTRAAWNVSATDKNSTALLWFLTFIVRCSLLENQYTLSNGAPVFLYRRKSRIFRNLQNNHLQRRYPLHLRQMSFLPAILSGLRIGKSRWGLSLVNMEDGRLIPSPTPPWTFSKIFPISVAIFPARYVLSLHKFDFIHFCEIVWLAT